MRTWTRVAAVAAAAALLAGACSDDSSEETADTIEVVEESGGTSTVVDDTLAPSATDVSPTGLQTVTTDYGDALALSDGQVLYAFESDTEGTGTCTDDCAVKWPPVEPSQATEYEGAELGQITRADGTPQLTVNGLPVYTFSGDLPGEATCQGGDGVWWILTTDGQLNKDTGG